MTNTTSQQRMTLQEMNRATLARQMLLEREPASTLTALERLAGLQAQFPQAPYVGLWTRLEGFQRDHLAAALDSHVAVKATAMRGTLHLLTTEDYARFRATLQPALTAGYAAIARGRGAEFDRDSVIETAGRFIAEQPRTFAEISEILAEQFPGTDVGAMRYAVRMQAPLVQVTAPTRWSFPAKPKFTHAEPWIGRPFSLESEVDELVRRYLAAFGPASPADMQTWSGLQGMKEVFERLRPELAALRDHRGRELFDLHDSPRPSETTPAPPRFLPEYDNLLLSHKDRSRFVPDEFRSRVYLPGLRVAATILVDGFVRGAWRTISSRAGAELSIEPFGPLTREEQQALAEEGENLVRFIQPDANHYTVTFEL